MPATLLFKHIHVPVYITNDLYSLNFIALDKKIDRVRQVNALDKKLTELDKLISKF